MEELATWETRLGRCFPGQRPPRYPERRPFALVRLRVLRAILELIHGGDYQERYPYSQAYSTNDYTPPNAALTTKQTLRFLDQALGSNAIYNRDQRTCSH